MPHSKTHLRPCSRWCDLRQPTPGSRLRAPRQVTRVKTTWHANTFLCGISQPLPLPSQLPSQTLPRDPTIATPAPKTLLVGERFGEWPAPEGAELTSAGGRHLAGDVGHVAVSTSPPGRTQAPGLGFLLNAGTFVFTRGPTAEVHHGLQRRQADASASTRRKRTETNRRNQRKVH